MSEIMQGTVEKVYVNDKKEGAYGDFWPQVLVIQGNKYSLNSKTAKPIANEGDSVQFLYDVNGKYNNIQFKSFENKGGGKPKPPQSNPGGGDSRTSDIKRGRAVNVAVSLVQAGAVVADDVEGALKEGLKHAVKLEVLADKYYDKLYEKAKLDIDGTAPQPEPEPQVEPEPQDDDIPF